MQEIMVQWLDGQQKVYTGLHHYIRNEGSLELYFVDKRVLYLPLINIRYWGPHEDGSTPKEI